ncbi:hypothetical protein KSP40_PGU012120 [Platanthera guangdongensis]|uniref:Uncharacterized protein n=1 Tax=Platanthera guangdongensis TaxID=2320717 RepID=A0ABR2LUU4_9ASPA
MEESDDNVAAAAEAIEMSFAHGDHLPTAHGQVSVALQREEQFLQLSPLWTSRHVEALHVA